jgi:hypothetical protein
MPLPTTCEGSTWQLCVSQQRLHLSVATGQHSIWTSIQIFRYKLYTVGRKSLSRSYAATYIQYFNSLYNTQAWPALDGAQHAQTMHGPHSSKFLCCSIYFCVVLCIDCFVSFSVLFVCICVLNYCHRLATQLQ